MDGTEGADANSANRERGHDDGGSLEKGEAAVPAATPTTPTGESPSSVETDYVPAGVGQQEEALLVKADQQTVTGGECRRRRASDRGDTFAYGVRFNE